MNIRLQSIVQQRGYDPSKIMALLELFGGDEAFVEQVLHSRTKSGDDDHLRLKTAYKARSTRRKAPGDDLDDLDRAYVALRDGLDAGDQGAAQSALEQLTTLASNQMGLTTKARRDPVAAAIQGWLGAN